MDDLIASALDKLDTILRTVAPGFIAVFAVGLVTDATAEFALPTSGEWRVIAFSVLLGFASYALHISVLEDVMMWPVLALTRLWFDEHVPVALRTGRHYDKLGTLSRERWARTVSSDQRIKAIQSTLGRGYSWLVFLYCSGYLLLVAAGVLSVWGNIPWSGVGRVVGAGAIALMAAVVWDTKITRHEMWLVKHFPQF